VLFIKLYICIGPFNGRAIPLADSDETRFSGFDTIQFLPDDAVILEKTESRKKSATMARVNRFGFLAIALTFHLVYIFSIFDIYFVSPIVSGMREFEVERPDGVEPPAKRLVLFVGRLQHCFSDGIDLLIMLAIQVTVFEQTKLSNLFQSPIQSLTRISPLDL
jgi:hypothetical protein